MATRRRAASVHDRLLALLDRNPREETLHQFIVANPALLARFGGPLMVSKPKFGAGLAADFLVRSVGNGTYHHFVEIERSGHALFTRAGVQSRGLNTALAQVRSWDAWQHDYMTHGDPLSASIVHYSVVIGRRSALSGHQRRLLAQLNNSMIRTEVMTWESLLDRLPVTADGSRDGLRVISDAKFRQNERG